MFDPSQPKIECWSSITNKWTRSSSFDVRKNDVRVRSMFDKMVFDISLYHCEVRNIWNGEIKFTWLKKSPKNRWPTHNRLRFKVHILISTTVWSNLITWLLTLRNSGCVGGCCFKLAVAGVFERKSLFQTPMIRLCTSVHLPKNVVLSSKIFSRWNKLIHLYEWVSVWKCSL